MSYPCIHLAYECSYWCHLLGKENKSSTQIMPKNLHSITIFPKRGSYYQLLSKLRFWLCLNKGATGLLSIQEGHGQMQ